jgi:endonuclease/exonuclease/phosphatase family metal-dependent hydrolase
MRMVTWNCWNFYDDVLGNCGDYCPYEEKLTSSQYQAKLAGVAKALRELDGDVVLLQEVENMGILDDLVNHADLKDMGYETRHLLPGNDPRGINIGLLSRVPVDDYISHKKDEFTRIDDPAYVYKFARDAVEIRMTYRGHKVGIVGVHFKARINDEDPNRRVAEAQQARAIADGLMASDPSMYVFVVGDFNDTPGTDTYTAVRNGPTSDSPIFEHAMASVPSADRYSYVYGSEKQLIDHMLASPNAGVRLDTDSAVILHNATAASDHHPMAATYTVP